MTSYKSSHAFESLQPSGLPGRPPASRTTPPEPHPRQYSTQPPPPMSPTAVPARKRSDSTHSVLTDFPSFSHPHSVAHSHLNFSSSLVREQSLALGNLERRQSFDTSSPSASHGHDSQSWATASATPSSMASHGPPLPSSAAGVSHKLPPPLQPRDSLAIHRQSMGHRPVLEGVNRSPPSGLSLLLKTNNTEPHFPHESTSSKSRVETFPSGQGNGGSSGEGHRIGYQRQGQKPPSPAPIDTTLARGGLGSHQADALPDRTTLTREPTAASDMDGDEFDDAAIEQWLASDSKRSGVGSILRKMNPFGNSMPKKSGQDRSVSESDPLLHRRPSAQSQVVEYDNVGARRQSHYGSLSEDEDDDSFWGIWRDLQQTHWTRKVVIQKFVLEPTGYIPAVILGLLLNLLDAVSYGMIIFPLNIAPFQALGPDGISMFFVSCIVSQLVYSLGGSAFKGGNGSMMIEVVPFLHIMAETVVKRVGSENRDEVLATTILAYALSTLMTGAVFMSLGYFKLGSLIAFFPRHILVGCIGGVGWFLIITGLEISSRMTTSLTYSLETLKFLFMDHHVLALWTSAFGLALLLRLLQYKIRHPFLVPVFFMVVPGLFYLVVAMADLDWGMLRAHGWVFAMPEGDAPGWQFYSYFDLKKTNWSAIMETLPSMLALTFFSILHVPINVPALGVSTGQDNVDTNRELVAHGWSNLLSGGVGTVQNYLVYTNSLLFIKSGGNSRVAGVMLAAASMVIFLVGPWIVGYIPVMVVGSLIFHLGLDLVKEALWDTWGLVHQLEYLTIALIVVAMAGFGFVEGIFLGILLACVFFVVTNSRKDGVRFSCTGESAKSTVRRVYRQQKFLRQVGRQIYIFKLQGDMFFGTINKVEKEIQDVFSRRRWEINPIQFLVLDFSLVRGVDFSAAEGFGRIRRAVRAKGVCLVLSGLDEDGEVGKALQMVGVWGAGAGAGLGEGHGHGQQFSKDGFDTQSFPGLSEALEFCENCLLESYYRTRESTLELARRKRLMEMANQDDASSQLSPDSETTRFFSEQLQNSPRKSHLFEAARETLHADRPFPHPINLQQPVPCLLAAFHDTRENSTDFFLRLSLFFVRRTVLAGTILWRQGGAPVDGIYLVEDGTLRSVQEFQDSGMIRRSTEVILPGTICGEIGLFTGSLRYSTVVSETDGVLWALSQDQFQRMVKEDPTLAVEFMRVAMSYSAERLNTMVAYAFSLS